jgi:hypothetical protein
MSETLRTTLKPPTVSTQFFHLARHGVETAAAAARPPVPAADESSAPLADIVVAADRPDSVSRFSRISSERISFALWYRRTL